MAQKNQKIVYVIGLVVIGAGLFGLVHNSPAYDQKSGTTVQANPPVEERTLEFYKKIATQMEEIKKDGEKNILKVIEVGKQYENDPNNKSGYFFNELGCAYIRIEDYEKAEEALQKGITVEPNRPSVHYDLGYCYLRMSLDKRINRMDDAKKHFERANELCPNTIFGENARKWLRKYF